MVSSSPEFTLSFIFFLYTPLFNRKKYKYFQTNIGRKELIIAISDIKLIYQTSRKSNVKRESIPIFSTKK